VGDPSSAEAARSILRQWSVPVPGSVLDALDEPTGVIPPGDPRLSLVENRVVAAPSLSLAAAAEMGRAAGCEVVMLGDDVEGEARVVAGLQAKAALAARSQQPTLLLSGGELTVTRRGSGVGGPNAEFALALAIELAGAPGVQALACDTDGVDGAAEVAGAMIDPTTLARAASLGWDPRIALERNDAHSFFAALSDQVVTGPTLTNVNDFRAILVQAAP
jgi:hydroxypyruvate reductase